MVTTDDDDDDDLVFMAVVVVTISVSWPQASAPLGSLIVAATLPTSKTDH